MSINVTLSADGLEEMFSVPTLKDLCLFKCLENKDILIVKVEPENEIIDWEKYRLKDTIQQELLEDLLDAGSKFLFKVTPEYAPILAGIRMSKPEHLVKLDLCNMTQLQDAQLEWLLSGGNVKWLDIYGCTSLMELALEAINKYGSELNYLRIGNCGYVLPMSLSLCGGPGILKTFKLRTFIICDLPCDQSELNRYCEYLLCDIINHLENLQIRTILQFFNLKFLEGAKDNLKSLSLANCKVVPSGNAWSSIFKLTKLTSLELIDTTFEEDLGYRGNIIKRILSSMPNLANLVMNPGAFQKNYFSDNVTTNNGGSMRKRLEILGVLDTDVDDILKARLLATDVISFGTEVEELRLLEYYSTHLNLGYFDNNLQRLFTSINNSNSHVWQSVAVLKKITNIYKKNGAGIVPAELFFSMMWKIITADVGAKCGKVIKAQSVEVLLSSMIGLTTMRDSKLPSIVVKILYMFQFLDAEIPFEQYVTVLTMVTNNTRRIIVYRSVRDDHYGWLMWLLRTTAYLLKTATERFCGKLCECWGMPSVLTVIKEYPALMKEATRQLDRDCLVETLSSFLQSVRKLCVNSAHRRQAFQFAGGVQILLGILEQIYDGSLHLAEPHSGIILDILKNIFKDTGLEILDPEEIASFLQQLVLTISSNTDVSL